jgi:hypothetical protein
MKRIVTLILPVAVALNACGALRQAQDDTQPAGGVLPSRATLPASSSGALLYVGNAVRIGKKFQGLLTILTFPDAKPYSTIRLNGDATGVCSDTSGNVWAVVRQDREVDAYEFAHGGAVPIAKIRVKHAHKYSSDCAVDPTTGNLAVLDGAKPRSKAMGHAEIWANARAGKPATFALPFEPISCTYDANGNLFVDGSIGSTELFALAELTKGSPSFAKVTLDRVPANYPGNIRWDGSYVDIVDNDFMGHGKIYRVDVTAYKGHVADVLHLHDLYYFAVFDVADGVLAGTAGNNGRKLLTWPYPRGGKASAPAMGFQYPPRGVAVSQ